ncbi:branched-chain amino acid aminotransferase [bacterium SCSIO 12696]|nr:branched-chain amino acid aminotransferase [bacterium SCSIO 12696]
MAIAIRPLNDEQRKPIPTELGFGGVFSDHMFTQEYRDGAWHDAAIGPYTPFTLDPSCAVLHYAQEIFEGLKAYRRPDGNINLFRPWDNAKRFTRSAVRMAMAPVDEAVFLESIRELVKLDHQWVPSEAGSSYYIRPSLIATQNALGVMPSNRYLHFVIGGPVGPYFKGGFNPVGVYISDTYRRAVKGGVGDAKTGGNYAASLFVGQEASDKGYSQVLWLDAIEGRYVEEVGAMNIMFVYGDKIITPKLTGSILPGITRYSVLEMANSLGYEISEEQIDVNDVLADIKSGAITEVFGCGTAAVIAPVGKFGMGDQEYLINNNQAGPVAKRIYDELTGIQYGHIEDRFGWTEVIEVV